MERNNKLELRRDRCDSMTKLKEAIRYWRQQGYKVYFNKGES